MAIGIDAWAVQRELLAISTAMSEVSQRMSPEIWEGGSAAAFTFDLEGHNRSLNRMMDDIADFVAEFTTLPVPLRYPGICRVAAPTGRPGVASVSPAGLEHLQAALTRAACALPDAAWRLRGRFGVVSGFRPSTMACERAAAWCHDEASRVAIRIEYALAEGQANPALLLALPRIPVPDVERFGRNELAALGRLQATTWNRIRYDATASDSLARIARALRAHGRDGAYLNAFFGGVREASIGRLAYDLHLRHGGKGLNAADRAILRDVGSALAALSCKKDGQAALSHALGPIGADMPGQALLVRLSARDVRWSSAVLTDMARAALRWRLTYPSYGINESSGSLGGEPHTTVLNQPHGRWWTPWGLSGPLDGEPGIATLNEYDPALAILGRISRQNDLTAARTLAATPLEPRFTIKDAEKADPLRWLSRASGGTYASLLIAPDWPDGGRAAGSVITLATTPEKGHEEAAALNAAEIMRSVAWWNDQGREKVDKLLKKDNPPDWLPWFNILPDQDETPTWMAKTPHYAAELPPALRTALLGMTRMHIPMLADANVTSAGSGLPNRDPATGCTYVDIGGQDVQQFLRTFASDDRAWTQIAADTRKYRRLLFTWGLRKERWPTATKRAGQLEGNLIAAFGKERLKREAITQQEYEDAKNHLGILRDLAGTAFGSTPVGGIPGATDAYAIGTDLALDKVKYADYEKKIQQIKAAGSTYSDQLYLDLAQAIKTWKGEDTGDAQLNVALRLAPTSPDYSSHVVWAVKKYIITPPGVKPRLSGEDLISAAENGADHNFSPE